MKKKILIGSIVTIVLLSMSFLVLTACNDKEPKPREVILEVVNPNTGEILQGDEHIDLPKIATYTEVRIKDKLTGVYLTDDDIPRNTIKGSCSIGYSVIDDDGRLGPLYTYGYWPTEIDWQSNYYRISVKFDCQPVSVVNPNYVKKYRDNVSYFRFYANR